MYSDFNIYLDLNWEAYVTDQEYLKKTYRVLKLAYTHHAQVYYCKSQLTDFLQHCGDLYEGFRTSAGEQLSLVLKNAKPVSLDPNFYFDVHFHSERSHISHVNAEILSAVHPARKNSIINIFGSSGFHRFLRIKADGDFDKVETYFLNDADNIIELFSTQGEVRNFHVSSKHGENGKGGWPGESVLECDRERAQILLNKAIVDLSVNKRHYCYDDNYGTYIEFFCEGNNPQKQWHGFHLARKDWHRVPASIKKYFGYS